MYGTSSASGKIVQNPAPDKFRHGDMMFVPFGMQFVAPGLGVREQLGAHPVFELLADLRLILAVLRTQRLARVRFHQGADHRHRARGIDDVNGFLIVGRRDLHRGMALARRRAADQQRYFQAAPFHLGGDMDHFVQRRA